MQKYDTVIIGGYSMRRYFLIMIVILCLCPFIGNALVEKSSDIYVTDEASILKEETKKYIIQYSSFLEEAAQVDYYVVTLDSLDTLTMDNYVDYIYQHFGMSDRGILIVACKKERNIYVKVGPGLSSVISNEMVDEYINTYFLSYLKAGDWDKGIQNGYSAFYKIICEEYDIDATEMYVDFGDIVAEYRYVFITIIAWICTILGYVYRKYFKRVFMQEDSSVGNHVVFAITLFVNILLVYGAYLLKPISVLFILGFELLPFMSHGGGSGSYSKKNTGSVKKKNK